MLIKGNLKFSQKQERLKKARESGWQNVLMGDTPRENKEVNVYEFSFFQISSYVFSIFNN